MVFAYYLFMIKPIKDQRLKTGKYPPYKICPEGAESQ
jgi:hypothetical protein